MLELRRVCAGYGRLRVLFDVDLVVNRGQLVSILGDNGAGKSTLLKTICGAIAPTSGEIVFRRQRVTSALSHQRVKMGISLSPEGRQVFPTLSVRENLVCGTYGLDAGEIDSQMGRVHELFPRLLERSDQRAGSLSGGEQQMLAIGRALMSKPRLLMVDELSLGLAPIVVEELYAALRALCDRGLTVIMVEQFHQFAAEHSDRQLTIEKGRLTEADGDGAAAEPTPAAQRRPRERTHASASAAAG